jgi:hypothetical protein
MFIGDGMGKTVIKASLNVVDGSTTFRSATVGQSITHPIAALHCTKYCLLHPVKSIVK